MITFLIIFSGIFFGQTLTMISPNDGGTFTIGEPMQIIWDAEGTSNPFKITLWQNDERVGLIADNVPAGNGRRTYEWERIGTLVDRTDSSGIGTGFKIQIKEKRGPAICKSRNAFRLVGSPPLMDPDTPTDASRSNRFPSVKVLSPNGGETLQRGREYLLKWEAVENFGRPRIIIKKGNSIEMNIPPERVFATKTRAGWHLSWIISNEISGGDNYRFRVENSNGRLWDESDRPFTVEAPGREITYTDPDDLGLLLTHQKVIRWRSSGVSYFRIQLLYSTFTLPIASRVSGNSYTWVVGQLAGSNAQVNTDLPSCKIQVLADDGGPSCGAESHSIKIERPPMNVSIEPNSMDIRRGERKTINWNTRSLHGKVNVELWYERSPDNWVRLSTILQKVIKNGSYNWHVFPVPKPGVGGLDYSPQWNKKHKIRLVSTLVDYLYAETGYFYLREK
jgi:hypothetical protein